MPRTLRTLLLSATALTALATAAAATPQMPTSTEGMAGMHATGTAQMHPETADMAGTAGMAGMHAAMRADPAVHEAMLDDPAMQAHLGEYRIDVDQMRRWHEAGGSVDDMHEQLAEQGIDVDAMQADCPMLGDASMATMHGNGGHAPFGHHRTRGGDR